jgi:hypothetical protein
MKHPDPLQRGGDVEFVKNCYYPNVPVENVAGPSADTLTVNDVLEGNKISDVSFSYRRASYSPCPTRHHLDEGPWWRSGDQTGRNTYQCKDKW